MRILTGITGHGEELMWGEVVDIRYRCCSGILVFLRIKDARLLDDVFGDQTRVSAERDIVSELSGIVLTGGMSTAILDCGLL